MRVPTTKVIRIGQQPVMLIERFDRYWTSTGYSQVRGFQIDYRRLRRTVSPNGVQHLRDQR